MNTATRSEYEAAVRCTVHQVLSEGWVRSSEPNLIGAVATMAAALLQGPVSVRSVRGALRALGFPGLQGTFVAIDGCAGHDGGHSTWAYGRIYPSRAAAIASGWTGRCSCGRCV